MFQPAQHQVRWPRWHGHTAAPERIREVTRTAGSLPPGCFFYRSLFKPDQTRRLPWPQQSSSVPTCRWFEHLPGGSGGILISSGDIFRTLSEKEAVR